MLKNCTIQHAVSKHTLQVFCALALCAATSQGAVQKATPPISNRVLKPVWPISKEILLTLEDLLHSLR